MLVSLQIVGNASFAANGQPHIRISKEYYASSSLDREDLDTIIVLEEEEDLPPGLPGQTVSGGIGTSASSEQLGAAEEPGSGPASLSLDVFVEVRKQVIAADAKERVGLVQQVCLLRLTPFSPR